jgi:hypothetical protein
MAVIEFHKLGVTDFRVNPRAGQLGLLQGAGVL